MLFQFQWRHPKRNQWYTNTYYDWDLCEERIDELTLYLGALDSDNFGWVCAYLSPCD